MIIFAKEEEVARSKTELIKARSGRYWEISGVWENWLGFGRIWIWRRFGRKT